MTKLKVPRTSRSAGFSLIFAGLWPRREPNEQAAAGAIESSRAATIRIDLTIISPSRRGGRARASGASVSLVRQSTPSRFCVSTLATAGDGGRAMGGAIGEAGALGLPHPLRAGRQRGQGLLILPVHGCVGPGELPLKALNQLRRRRVARAVGIGAAQLGGRRGSRWRGSRHRSSAASCRPAPRSSPPAMRVAEAHPGALRLAQAHLPSRFAGRPPARFVIQEPIFPVRLLCLSQWRRDRQC